MGCGCRKNNSFSPRSKSGPIQSSALRPATATNRNIIGPVERQSMAQTSSQTPSPIRNDSSTNQEKRKVQQARRDAIKKSFGK